MPALLLSLLTLGTLAMSGWPWSLLARDQEWPAEVRAGLGWLKDGWERPPGPVVMVLDKDGPGRMPTQRDCYAQALRWFREAPRYHPAVYWLTGNAEYLLSNMPGALLEYRKGLAGAPTNKRLRESLDFARSNVVYPIPEARPPMPSAWVCPRCISDASICLMFVAHVFACLCFTSWLTSRRWKWARLAMMSFVLATASGLASVGFAEWTFREQQTQIGVINDDAVALRQGNGASYPAHPALPHVNRGMEARVLHSRGGWLQLEFPGGYLGWVPAEKVLVGFF